MEEEKLRQLKEMQEQMITLRNDNSLLTGITFNTLAGDIHIAKREIVTSMIDSMIKYLKDEIKYKER